MNAKTLITVLVLGTSTAAVAHPSVSAHASVHPTRRPLVRGQSTCDQRVFVDPQGDDGIEYRGPSRTQPVHRDDDPTTWYGGPRTYRPLWVSLTEPTQIERGRERIRIGPQVGTFIALRLQATTGRTYLDRVIVKFSDGTRQVAPIRQEISRTNPIVQLELDDGNRLIDGIVVIGASGPEAAYQVFGI